MHLFSLLLKDDGNFVSLSLHLHSTQPPSHQCSVVDLAVDDVSLPGLIQLGLHTLTLCSQVTKLRLELSEAAKSDTVDLLLNFPAICSLVLDAFRYTQIFKHQYEACMV